MRSSKTEWFGLFVSLAFTFIGAWMALAPRKPQDTLSGWTCAVFFGLAALTFAHTLWSRYRGRGYLNAEVTLAPGARFTLKRGRLLFLGTAMTLVGTLGVLDARRESQWIVAAAAGLFLAGGLALLLLNAAGFIGNQYLLFEPEGLRIGDRGGSFLIAWDNLARVEVGEYHRNPVVSFWFKDLEALGRTVRTTSKRWSQEKVLKGVHHGRKWLRCDWMLFTWHYGLDSVLLAKAVLTYIQDPEVREGLRKRLELEGSAP